MNGVEYLVGSDRLTIDPLPVYSKESLMFLAELSEELLRTSGVRAWPDVVSTAFWCRRANLIRLRDAYKSAADRLGRGLAFHIAPSNIPVNFAFTYFFSLLAGNANIVRIPSKPFTQVSMICEAFQRVLPRHPEIARRTAFVTYPADDETTAAFCENADVRVIWGGDHTVANVKRYPTRPRCVDIVFPDRYSICLLNGNAILAVDGVGLRRLAEGFYNDTYLMDQNACSSPQMVLWLNASDAAENRFWEAVVETAGKKYELQGMTAVDKYVHLCEDAIKHNEIGFVARKGGNLLYRAQLSELPGMDKTSLRGKGGYFYECRLESPDELCRVVDEKYQTLTYFGADAKELRRLVMENRLRGIDRIVPVGKAMDIGVFWDGYDLVSAMSRYIAAE